MFLWIDDLRPAPDGWCRALSSRQAIEMLSSNTFSVISFDHDLGGDDTTRPVIIWMIENEIRAECRVHSANPVGREWLVGMIERYLT